MITGPSAARLTRTFQELVARIGERAALVAAARWQALGSYDETDVARFAAQTRAATTGAHAAAIRAGTGYYSTLAQIRPPSVAVRDVPLEVDPREPFIAYWNALDGGHPWEAARESGRARSMAVMRNLATSTSRRAGDVTMAKARLEVVGWERNTDGGACEWCRGLTSHVFKSAESADFGHDRCGCSVAPLVAA